MTEVPRGQWFIPGDRISFVLSFRHEMNAEEVRAVFAHAGTPSMRIELTGAPTLEEQHGIYTFSSAELTSEVAPDTVPGEYRCEGLLIRSVGGRDVPFDEVPDLCFLAIEEPVGTPTIGGCRSSGESTVGRRRLELRNSFQDNAVWVNKLWFPAGNQAGDGDRVWIL